MSYTDAALTGFGDYSNAALEGFGNYSNAALEGFGDYSTAAMEGFGDYSSAALAGFGKKIGMRDSVNKVRALTGAGKGRRKTTPSATKGKAKKAPASANVRAYKAFLKGLRGLPRENREQIMQGGSELHGGMALPILLSIASSLLF